MAALTDSSATTSTDTSSGSAENIHGQIWLFEAHDGVAVPLHAQPAGLVGVEAFYDLTKVKPQGCYSVVVTNR
jgi:hypothetical protein